MTASLPLLVLFGQDGDVGQMAQHVVVIETVTDHEGVGDIEAAVIRFNRDLLPSVFPQQDADTHRCRPRPFQVLYKMGQRLPRVENVVKKEDVVIADVGQ